MKTRILSAAVLLPLLFAVSLLGGLPLLIFIDIAAVLGLIELKNAFKNVNKTLNLYLLIIFSQIHIFFTYNLTNHNFLVIILPLILFSGMLTIIKKYDFSASILDIFSFCYCVLPIGIIYNMRAVYQVYFWMIFVISMTTDTFAYFCGKFFGKTKLVPRLSPNKTVEGSIGGIIFTVLALLLYSNFVDFKFFESNALNVFFQIVFAVLGSIISQIGDLFASGLKRTCKIKDFGKIIPGHGGIMDRADSIIFTAIYIYAVVLIKQLAA